MKKIIFLFTFCFSIICLSAQNADNQIITLTEESTTSKYKQEIPAEGVAIVDINSRILVKVNIAEVENAMFRFQGIASTDNRLKKLKELNTLMRGQNEILNLLNAKFRNGREAGATLADYKKLARLVDNVLAEIEETASEEVAAIIYGEEADQLFLNSNVNSRLLIFELLGREADKLRQSLLNEININGKVDSSLLINFRLGAFIKNKSGGRPIHIENFDDLTPDDYIEIERFGAPLTEEEEKELAINKNINDSLQLNMSSLGSNFKSIIRAKKNALFPSDTSKIKLRQVYQTSIALLDQDSQTLPASKVLKDNPIDLPLVNNLYRVAIENFNNFTFSFPKNFWEGDNYFQTFDQLTSFVQAAYETFHTAVNTYESTATPVDGEIPGLSQLGLVDNSYNQYNVNVHQDVEGIKQLIENIQQLLNPFRKSYIENEQFTDAVRRFTVGKIPTDGYIELKGIGERKAGDEIMIKAIIERGQNKNHPNYEDKEIYRRYISMNRITPHLKMSGSLILANPYRRDQSPLSVKLENKFQFAPNYGIFMKWGSRKSKFYNDFLTPGLGLGFSSPDFNLDGTPEFGAGFMMTAFRDILSVGWTWNFGVDTPYTFVGFNIPFTVGGLPGANSATGYIEN